MASATESRITRLLDEWKGGDEAALERLMLAVYEQLCALAASYLRRARGDHTLAQPGALVGEACGRFLATIRNSGADWRLKVPANRAELFGQFSRIMRHTLIDHWRGRKVRGEDRRVAFDEAEAAATDEQRALLKLVRALEELGTEHPRHLRAFELHYLAGWSVREVARELGVEPPTVYGYLRLAKAHVYDRLEGA